MMAIQIKRVYEVPSKSDGYRILVDRLWPRGIKKENAGVDIWIKEVGPSTDLRKWFDHDPKKWNEFSRRYRAELKGSAAFKELSVETSKHKTVTLLFAAKDEEHNNAVILQQLLS